MQISAASFKPETFESMKFNIFKLTAKDKVIFHFPELSIYSQFNGTPNISHEVSKSLPKDAEDDVLPEIQSYILPRDMAIRYAMYAYDPGSPFIKIKEGDERKRLALEISGLSSIKEGKKVCEFIMNGEIAEVSNIVAAYFMVINDRQYELWISGLEAYSQLLSKVRQPINDRSADAEKLYLMKSKCFTDAKEMAGKLDEIEEKLFGGDINLKKDIVKGKGKSVMEKMAINSRANHSTAD